jgi:FAD-dependent urate hydroxylase
MILQIVRLRRTGGAEHRQSTHPPVHLAAHRGHRAHRELAHAVRSVAEPVSAMVIHSWTGNQLAARRTERRTDPACDSEPTCTGRCMTDLYRALHDAARRDGVRIEHSAAGPDPHRRHRRRRHRPLRRRIDRGRRHPHRRRGIRSTGKSLIDLTAPAPRDTGLLGFGGSAAGAAVASTVGDYHMIFGKEAFSAIR